MKKAAQAILKNHSLVICSGSGMTADCTLRPNHVWSKDQTNFDKIPIFTGTKGLWKHYPVMRKNGILFEEFMTESFFKEYPTMFWYVYGDLYNKL